MTLQIISHVETALTRFVVGYRIPEASALSLLLPDLADDRHDLARRRPQDWHAGE
jgi:hypothetical protein